jgi:ABC-type glutathione transport system ATPase component
MELENFRKFGRREWFAQTQVVYQDTTGTFMPDEVLENHFKRIERLRGADEEFWEALDYWGQKLELFDSEKMDHEPLDSYINQSLRHQFLSKKFDELSMGMRRRTGLLRAFLLLQTFDEIKGNPPKLLLLDEVSRGLDAQNRSLMADAISEFSNKFNVSVVSVSHDFGFLSEFCDHVRTMYDGQLLPLEISFREVLKIRNGDTIEGLDHPYYEQFIRGEENWKNMDESGI